MAEKEKSISVDAEAAAKLRRRITALKGHFTRTEARVLKFTSRASEQIVAAGLAELNGKAEEILDLFTELIEICPRSEVKTHELAFRTADDDMNK